MFDLLEEMRTALDGLDARFAQRTIDIEMSRVNVLADPTQFRGEFADAVASALAHTGPSGALTVRVERTGKSARVDVIDDDNGTIVSSMTLPLAPGTGSAADG